MNISLNLVLTKYWMTKNINQEWFTQDSQTKNEFFRSHPFYEPNGPLLFLKKKICYFQSKNICIYIIFLSKVLKSISTSEIDFTKEAKELILCNTLSEVNFQEVDFNADSSYFLPNQFEPKSISKNQFQSWFFSQLWKDK